MSTHICRCFIEYLEPARCYRHYAPVEGSKKDRIVKINLQLRVFVLALLALLFSGQRSKRRSARSWGNPTAQVQEASDVFQDIIANFVDDARFANDIVNELCASSVRSGG